MKRSLFVCLSLLAACGGSTGAPEPLVEDTATSQAPLAGKLEAVAGESTCAPGTYLMPVAVARANLKAVCDQLVPNDLVRLEGGGAMKVTYSGCDIYDLTDSKRLGSLCMSPPESFYPVKGDGTCSSGYTLMSPQEARDGGLSLCDALGRWDTYRLSGGGSLTGRGYATYCNIQDQNPQPTGYSLCKPTRPTFSREDGDWPCAPWQGLVSPDDARRRLSEICPMVGKYESWRLSGGGSVTGVGYGNTCTVNDWDTRTLGRSLCQSLF